MAVTSSEENVSIGQEFMATVFNGRNYDAASEYLAKDCVQHGPDGDTETRGIDAVLESMKMYHEAFSDLEAVEELSFGDGEYVCALFTYQGTHDGDFLGIEPTDVSAEVRGITISRFEEGKIVESHVLVDFTSLFQQLGATPTV